MTHICVGNLTIIGSDNGLSPGRRQAITWTNFEILLIGPLETNFSEILSVLCLFWICMLWLWYRCVYARYDTIAYQSYAEYQAFFIHTDIIMSGVIGYLDNATCALNM